MTFEKAWRFFQEDILFPTDSLAGMRVDGVQMDGQILSTVIPRKYNKEKWGFNKSVKKLTLTGQDQTTITVTAAPDCYLSFNHYGGKQIELLVRPGVKTQDLKQKTRQETKIGYTIEFGKAE